VRVRVKVGSGEGGTNEGGMKGEGFNN